MSQPKKNLDVGLEQEKKRKTTTSTAVKQRYNTKTYTAVTAYIDKETAAAFKQKCIEKGIPQAQVIKAAVRDFIDS